MFSYNDIVNNPEITHVLVPFCNDESATIFFPEDADDQFLFGVNLDKDDASIPDEQLRSYFRTLTDFSADYIAEASYGDLFKIFTTFFVDEVNDVFDLKPSSHGINCGEFDFDSLAVVPKEHVSDLIDLAALLAGDMEDDGSCYEAVETFNETLKDLAVEVLDI